VECEIFHQTTVSASVGHDHQVPSRCNKKRRQQVVEQ
jgi:hypothetical protein